MPISLILHAIFNTLDFVSYFNCYPHYGVILSLPGLVFSCAIMRRQAGLVCN